MSHARPPASTADLPDGYRMTELGPLPEEWRVARLGEVYTIQQGKALSSKHRKGKSPFPFLRTANVLWGYVDLSNLDTMDFTEGERAKLRLHPGDLLICEGGEIGRTAIWEGQLEDVFYQNHIFRVRVTTKKAYPHFHMYWMQAAIKVLGLYRGRGNKTTIPNLSKRRLAEFPIPLPPLSEQRAIAHVLRTVQKAREATERVIAALRDLKRSLMRHLFTYGPVPVDAADQVALQDTPIGPIPAHWRVVRLGEVVKLRKGTVQPSDVPNARYVGLEHLIPGEIRIKQFSRAGITRSAKALFEKGDILYGKLRPYLDKAALAEWAGVCSTDILVLQPSEEQLSLFIVYLMHTPFVLSHAVATTTGVNHPRTSWKALSQALVPLPPFDEQHEIARILQTVDRKIEAEEARKQALDDLFRSLLHHLMTAKVRLPQGFVQQFG